MDTSSSPAGQQGRPASLADFRPSSDWQPPSATIPLEETRNGAGGVRAVPCKGHITNTADRHPTTTGGRGKG